MTLLSYINFYKILDVFVWLSDLVRHNSHALLFFKFKIVSWYTKLSLHIKSKEEL